MLAAEAIGGPGMLGLDLLDGGQLTFDFKRQTLTIDSGAFMPVRRRRSPGGAGKLHRRDGQLTLVDADLAGIKVTAFLDSEPRTPSAPTCALRELAVTAIR